jgi:hypothetical protein
LRSCPSTQRIAWARDHRQRMHRCRTNYPQTTAQVSFPRPGGHRT